MHVLLLQHHFDLFFLTNIKVFHSVCPLVGIGTPIPSPASECVPPEAGTKGGGDTLACD
jgi:hypothetical protein